MTHTIYPVILCGGSGTRLWPLSRKSYPKQFSDIFEGETLFQASAKRLTGAGFADPVILTNSDFRFIVTEQLEAIGKAFDAILIEPEGKNTAPAVLAAALYLADKDPEAMMLVAPSDHVIADPATFKAAVQAGASAAMEGDLVTFGIRPDRAETGYGYLEQASGAGDFAATPRKLKRFVEKPDADAAQDMVDSGNFLWNGGIFLFSVAAIVKAFETHAPDLMKPVGAAVKAAKSDLDFLRLDPKAWAGCEDISIDYAVMERASNISVVPYDSGWSDLGSWEAVWREGGPDETGVVASGPAQAINCENTLLRAEADGQELVGIGLKNIVAVSMPDAVMVADMSDAQNVKQAVQVLKDKGAKQAVEFPRDHRPWGWFESLVIGDRFQVKRIVVHPGAALSLQSHVHRSEHWIVVEGTAKVTVDEEVKLVGENQSVYIPLGAVHRMENPGKVPMVLIEVQTGSYLGEDDIIRYEDVYARESGD